MNGEPMREVSRRGFLKRAGLGAGAVALSAGTLQACSSAASTVSSGVSNDSASWDLETDVVVVGYGGAGACAAIEAADGGVSVIVLEKNAEDSHLCNSLMSGGIFHCPSADGDQKALKDYVKAMFSGENLPNKNEGEQSPLFVDGIVDKYCEWSMDNVDFLKRLDPDIILTERGGAAFPDFPGAAESKYMTYNSSYVKGGAPLYPTLDMPKEETAQGLAFWNCLMTGIADRADAISVKWETPGKELITNDSGEVTGVVATSGDKDLRIKAAKGVILTTGGYEYSEEMRRAFCEGPGITGWAFYGTTSNEGDGIRMAASIGAQMAKVGKAASRLIWQCPDVVHNNMQVGSITDSVGTQGTVVVNSEGARFMDESLITRDPSRYFAYKEAVKMDITDLTFPNNPAYMIIDESRRLQGPLVNLTLSVCGFGMVEWDLENQIPVDKGWMLKGNTLEELAEKIKVHEFNKGRFSTETFMAAMAQYQEMVDTGVDTAFGRESKYKDPLTAEVKEVGFQAISTPPFYALPLVAGGPNTKGGIQADGDRRVIDWFNKPIPRLYSAGEMSSTFKFVYQGGGNITECICCGRIAGANAAAETPWE